MAQTDAFATRTADFADAIRSIALEEIEGISDLDRPRHLANFMKVPFETVRYQIDEMVSLLAN